MRKNFTNHLPKNNAIKLASISNRKSNSNSAHQCISVSTQPDFLFLSLFVPTNDKVLHTNFKVRYYLESSCWARENKWTSTCWRFIFKSNYILAIKILLSQRTTLPTSNGAFNPIEIGIDMAGTTWACPTTGKTRSNQNELQNQQI